MPHRLQKQVKGSDCWKCVAGHVNFSGNAGYHRICVFGFFNIVFYEANNDTVVKQPKPKQIKILVKMTGFRSWLIYCT